jgi:hypothetical protein
LIEFLSFSPNIIAPQSTENTLPREQMPGGKPYMAVQIGQADSNYFILYFLTKKINREG